MEQEVVSKNNNTGWSSSGGTCTTATDALDIVISPRGTLCMSHWLVDSARAIQCREVTCGCSLLVGILGLGVF